MLVRDKCEMKDIGMSEFFRALLIDELVNIFTVYSTRRGGLGASRT